MRRLTGLWALGTCVMLTGCFDEEKLHGVPLSLELTARKDYRPSRWTDGVHSFDKDTKFKVPAKLDVVFGNSGNHKSYLFFKKAKDKKESRCEYQGGSSQSHPKGQKELDKAKVYRFVKCDGGLKADDFAVAKDLRLRLDNGGNEKESAYTIIKATILYAGAAPTPTPTVVVTPVVTPTPVVTGTPTPSPTPDIFAGLPPDPGEAGKATLQGIDADSDGVRDDVQRFIKASYPNSLPQRRAATQYAKGILSSLSAAEPATSEVHTWAAKDMRSSECMTFVFGLRQKRIERAKIMQAIVNTDARNRSQLRWLKHMGGFYGSLVQDGQEATTCEFNTSEQ
jgi:hypothetical protein